MRTGTWRPDAETVDVLRNKVLGPGSVPGFFPLLVSVVLLMAGNGLLGSLVGVRGALEGYGDATLGVIVAGFYAGYLLGSFGTPRLIVGVGHVRVFAALASLASAAVLVQAVVLEPVAWLGLRFVTGACIAGLFVVVESWLTGETTPTNRGRVFGLYMTVLLGAMAGGQFLLTVADPGAFTPFVIGSVLVSLAVLPTALSPTRGPALPPSVSLRTKQVWEAAPLAVLVVFVHGMAIGVLMSMTPVLGRSLGFSVAQIALLVAAVVLASMAAQFPLGAVSDHTDRRYVIAGAAVVAVVASTGGALVVDPARPVVLIAIIALISVGSGPLYGLAVAHLADYLDAEQMPAAGSRVVMIQGAGAAMGPLVVGFLLATQGAVGFFWFLVACHVAVVIYSALRLARRPAVPEDERAAFAPLVGEATPQAVVAIETAEADL